MANLRTNPIYQAIMDLSTVGKDFDVDGTENTPQRINTYIINCIEGYELTDNIDDLLYDDFTDDFEGWTEPLFAQADKTVRTALKNHLRDQGLYVGGKSKVTQQLIDLLNNGKVPEWPEEDLDRQRKAKKKNFRSHTFNPGFDQPEGTEAGSDQEILPTRKLRSRTKTTKEPEVTVEAAKDSETAKEPKKPAKKMKKTGKAAASPNPSDDDGGSSSTSGDDIGGKDTPIIDQVKSLTQFLTKPAALSILDEGVENTIEKAFLDKFSRELMTRPSVSKLATATQPLSPESVVQLSSPEPTISPSPPAVQLSWPEPATLSSPQSSATQPPTSAAPSPVAISLAATLPAVSSIPLTGEKLPTSLALRENESLKLKTADVGHFNSGTWDECLGHKEELEGHAVFIRSFNQSFLPTRLPDCESHKVYRSWKRRKKKESH
jgi:hypothetical protein